MGPLIQLKQKNGTNQAIIGLIPDDNNFPWREESLEFRMPDNGRINFFNSNDVTNSSNMTMTLLGDGNVGIGTTTPTNTLDVNGFIGVERLDVINGSNVIGIFGDTNEDKWLRLRRGGGIPEGHAGLIFSNFNGNNHFIYNDGSRLNFTYDAAAMLNNPDVGTSSSNLCIENSTGNVGIGTTSPSEALDVNGKIKLGSFETFSDEGGLLMGVNSSFIPVDDNSLDLGNSTNRWFEVWSANGTINTSDARDKTNIQDLNYGLEEVLNLRPVKYQWKNDTSGDEKIGLIAQEILTVLPEVVKTHDQVRLDEQNPSSFQTVELQRMGVYYSDIIPVLVKAIQEQQGTIHAIEAENSELKANNKALLNRLDQLESAVQALSSK